MLVKPKLSHQRKYGDWIPNSARAWAKAGIAAECAGALV